MSEQTTRPVFNHHAGITGRDGGPYLDQVEAREAEKRRAVVEDREPDLDNPGAVAGTPLVPIEYIVASAGANSNPSQGGYDFVAEAVLDAAKNPEKTLYNEPVAEAVIPVDPKGSVVLGSTEVSHDEGDEPADNNDEPVVTDPPKTNPDDTNSAPVFP